MVLGKGTDSLLVSAALVVFAALTAPGCSDLGVPIQLRARSELSATSLDFGTVAVTASATRTMAVSNSGNADLTGDAEVACAEFQIVSGGGPFTIAPGASRSIVVRFAPSAVGPFPCTLDLGPGSPQVALVGSGAVQAPGARCTALPDSIDLGFAAVGNANSGAIQIYSTGTAPLLVNVVSTSGDFIVVSGGGPAEIPAGGFINAVVEFRPQAGRKRSGTISIGPGCPDVNTKGVGTTISLRNDIRPILSARCNEACHNHLFMDPVNGDLYLHSYVAAYDTTSFASYLYLRITHDPRVSPMPPTGIFIPLEERNKFRDWIMEGVTDN